MGKKKAKSNGKASVKENKGGASGAARVGAGGVTSAAPQNGQRSTLQSRREKMQSRARAVQDAEQEVSRLEERLDNTSRATREQESALAAATARVADLEQSLMTSHRERSDLQAALEQVRGDAHHARERAAAAERKYDQAVLEEVVRREKAIDLTLHTN